MEYLKISLKIIGFTVMVFAIVIALVWIIDFMLWVYSHLDFLFPSRWRTK